MSNLKEALEAAGIDNELSEDDEIQLAELETVIEECAELKAELTGMAKELGLKDWQELMKIYGNNTC